MLHLQSILQQDIDWCSHYKQQNIQVNDGASRAGLCPSVGLSLKGIKSHQSFKGLSLKLTF